jgi:hypothetical protein
MLGAVAALLWFNFTTALGVGTAEHCLQVTI